MPAFIFLVCWLDTIPTFQNIQIRILINIYCPQREKFSYFSFSCKRKQFLLDCVVNLGNFCKTFYVFLAPTNQVRKDPDSYSPLCPTTVLIRQRKVRICNKWSVHTVKWYIEYQPTLLLTHDAELFRRGAKTVRLERGTYDRFPPTLFEKSTANLRYSKGWN